MGRVESLLVMVLRLPAFVAPQVPSLKALVVFDLAVQEELLQYGLFFACRIIPSGPAASTSLRPLGDVGVAPLVPFYSDLSPLPSL